MCPPFLLLSSAQHYCRAHTWSTRRWMVSKRTRGLEELTALKGGAHTETQYRRAQNPSCCKPWRSCSVPNKHNVFILKTPGVSPGSLFPPSHAARDDHDLSPDSPPSLLHGFSSFILCTESRVTFQSLILTLATHVLVISPVSLGLSDRVQGPRRCF